MPRRIAQVTLLVREYDEAIAFYVNALGFTLVEDTDMGNAKRWVRVRPGPGSAEFLLARATTPQQQQAVGAQTGGRVMAFIQTDDFARDYELMRSRGVTFHGPPRHEPYGTVAVFEDLYGNRFDLIQPRPDA